MAKKTTGCGTILSLDESGGTTYTAVSNIANVTPATQSRVIVESPELDTCENNGDAGREEVKTMSFMQYWEPGDTDHERVDTMYANNTDGGWKIEYGHDYAVSQPAQTFNGKVQEMAPAQVVSEEVVQRSVTIVLTSSIVTVPGADI